MSAGRVKVEPLVDGLLLDVKALMLLSESDSEAEEVIKTKLSKSLDEDVIRFVTLVQTMGEIHPKRSTLSVAVGQILLGAMLLIAGIIMLAPAIIGINTAGAIANYFAMFEISLAQSSTLYPVAIALDLLLSITLLLASFFSLRHAATNLRDAGLFVRED